MLVGSEAVEGGDDPLAAYLGHGVRILEAGAPAELGQRLAGLLLNQFLMGIGVIDQPLIIMNTNWAIYIGIV